MLKILKSFSFSRSSNTITNRKIFVNPTKKSTEPCLCRYKSVVKQLRLTIIQKTQSPGSVAGTTAVRIEIDSAVSETEINAW